MLRNLTLYGFMVSGTPTRIQIFLRAKISDLKFEGESCQLELGAFKTQGTIPLNTLVFPADQALIAKIYVQVRGQFAKGSDNLMITQNGNDLRSVSKIFQELGFALFGIHRFCSHIIRDSYISAMFENDIELPQAIRIANCMLVDITTLLRHYVHLAPAKQATKAIQWIKSVPFFFFFFFVNYIPYRAPISSLQI